MLTRQLAICDYDLIAGRIVPDRLTRRQHGRYLGYAERMQRVYQMGTGRTRQELHRAVWSIFADEPDCPARRIDAFCKLLDDAATYERDRRGQAAALRRQVFRLAAAQHPLVRKADRLFEHAEAHVKAHIAAEVGRSWEEIDRDLFADVAEFHRLAAFQGYPDAAALLARYNVAQVQAALFDAVSMTVWADDDFKTILRYAKLARLMHTITGNSHQEGDARGRYMIRFDGPASVLRQTRRYGVAMAAFLPALIACRSWRMHAVIQTGRRGWIAALDLSAADGLHSHLPPPETFDSQVEDRFAQRWGSEKRDGWTLVREGEILDQGQKVFVPDFVFRHDDGRRVLMEIVGFWTPEYLEAKFKTLEMFREHRILLAIAAGAAKRLPALPATALLFKASLPVQDVLNRLNPRLPR